MIDWKARIRNKYFWIALVSAILILLDQLGMVVPSNAIEITNTILTIFVILGIIIDPSSKGITDKPKELGGK